MPNKRIAGVCFIKVDGQQLQVKGDVEVPITSLKRETVMGLSGPAGYKETAEAPYVKVTALFTSTLPLDKIIGNTEMTVTAELANGKVYVLSGAYLTDQASAKADDGTIELNFEGARGEFLA
ncbi:MAG: phage tail tube protein [Alphaproteobacteria bacterium]|nr:MAG: phage tail tube protein [Alphaproteobacteria bacterium]